MQQQQVPYTFTQTHATHAHNHVPSPNATSHSHVINYVAASTHHHNSSRSRRKWILPVIAILATSILLFTFTYLYREALIANYPKVFKYVIRKLHQLDIFSITFFFVLTYSFAACLFFPPASIINFTVGYVLGVPKALAFASINATLAATLAFLLARYVARNFIMRKLSEKQRRKFDRITSLITEANGGFRIIVLARMSPMFPYAMLNYLFGLIKQTDIRAFILSSWLGMLPSTFVHVYFGSLVRGIITGSTLAHAKFMHSEHVVEASVQMMNSHQVPMKANKFSESSLEDEIYLNVVEFFHHKKKQPFEWFVLAFGLLSTVAVTGYVANAASKALNSRIAEDDSSPKLAI